MKYLNQIVLGDCLDIMKELPDNSIDLVMTDPPYLIKNTKAGGKTKFSKSIQGMNDEIKAAGLTDGVSLAFCEEIIRLQNKVNAYIWCNKGQIIDYLNFFVTKHKCSFDILCWLKDNPMPTFHNKYLTDKEYCLYFSRGGYCMPGNYQEAKTVFFEPINIKDKNQFGHPTIKPLSIIIKILKNSAKTGSTILDCFSGSGTTAVACHDLNLNFICIEKDPIYHAASVERLEEHKKQLILI